MEVEDKEANACSSCYRSSNISLDRAKDIVKGSLKALNNTITEPDTRQTATEFSLVEGEVSSKQTKWTFLLILTGIVTTIGSSMPVGYNIGVMNTPQIIIKEFCNASVIARYGIVPNEIVLNVLWSCIVSIFLIGGMIGSLSGSWIADKWGRKGTILVTHVLNIIAAVLFLSSPAASSVELLLIARFLLGLAGGITTSILPMYLTEIAPLELRGALGTLCPLGLTVGVVVAQVLGLHSVLGTPSTWHYLLALYGLLILIAAVVHPFLPESPKYLYVICKEEERGAKELSRLRGVPISQLSSELQAIKSASKVEAGKWSVKKLLMTPSLRWPLILVCALQGGQQLSGINAVFYYSVPIFLSAGLDDVGSQYASIGCGIINFVVAILAMVLANKYSRRKLMFFSCGTACACLTFLTIAILNIDTISWMPYFAIAMVLSYVFFYGFGLGPIPYFIGSELFTVGPRPAAMALGSMANWTGNFFVGMTFPSLQSLIGAYSFVPFVVMTALLGLLLWWRLPETLGVDPVDPECEEITEENRTLTP